MREFTQGVWFLQQLIGQCVNRAYIKGLLIHSNFMQ